MSSSGSTNYHIAAEELRSCYDGFAKRFDIATEEEQKDSRFIALKKDFDETYPLVKELSGSYPHSRQAGREIYIEFIQAMHRMILSIETNRGGIPLSQHGPLYAFLVACEWGFDQPHNERNSMDAEYGSLVRNK